MDAFETVSCTCDAILFHIFMKKSWKSPSKWIRKVVNLSINFKKSPYPHVCEHSDRSTRRMTFPFASANYICFKDHLEHKQWGLTMRRKFFWSPRAPPSRFQKLSFWGLSKGKVVYLGINFKKSPSPHVCDHSDRSTRRATFPFAFANYICFQENLEHK